MGENTRSLGTRPSSWIFLGKLSITKHVKILEFGLMYVSYFRGLLKFLYLFCVCVLFFQVKPVLARLKNTLVILGLSLILVINLGDSPIATSYRTYRDPRDRSSLPIPGAYNDETARTFEPEAFCGEPSSDLL